MPSALTQAAHYICFAPVKLHDKPGIEHCLDGTAGLDRKKLSRYSTLAMPAGKTHLRIELFLLPLWGALFSLFIDPSWQAGAVFTGAYLFSSLLLSPDLDLRYNRSRRHWGVFGCIWVPYTKIFKHRGISHSVLLGTLTRLGYLGLLALLIAFAFGSLGVWTISPDSLTTSPIDPRFVAILCAGLWLPNIIHILTDRIYSARARRRH